GSESSWDKDKLQSPITTGSQHSIGHPALSGQSSLGSAHPLSPLQQNHLLTNRIDLPFMMMPHPLLPVSLPPASVAMAMNQMNHLNTIANMAAAAQMHSPLSRAGASVIKERIQDSPSPAPSLEDSQRPGSHASSHQSSSVSSSPSQLDNTPDRIALLTNSREGELIDQETGTSLKKIQKERFDLLKELRNPGCSSESQAGRRQGCAATPCRGTEGRALCRVRALSEELAQGSGFLWESTTGLCQESYCCVWPGAGLNVLPEEMAEQARFCLRVDLTVCVVGTDILQPALAACA
ncbi:PREDICTED: dachshund homolog 2-like, partial [Cariama cristata]|uniref:dachshund homolog 2-like n=1 Tax=Cariama cristata TaxID=54380 RepID=UPI000520A050